MEKLVELVAKEWQTLKEAPITFLLVLIFAAFAGAYAARWLYAERIEVLQQRLSAKDDQLAEYRERLHLAPAGQTAYSQLTNGELKQRALRLIGNIREFLERTGEEDRKVTFAQFAAMSMAKSEEEKNQLWHRQTEEMSRRSFQRSADYDRQFKVEAILLRDEILSRLPPTARDDRKFGLYEHPTNPIGMGMVADDLERLARSLP